MSCDMQLWHSGIFRFKWVCNELFREDLFIERMGVFVYNQESYKRELENARVASLDGGKAKIYDWKDVPFQNFI
ncbi:hypothetical protein HS7_11270 [Sulfolobales archaeon HS-7]|nr:hypothetical protein HS7_11270 [Sulfolobales archaeon HS-7]